MKTISEKEFHETYLPTLNHFYNDPENEVSFGGLLYETYEPEYDYIRSQDAKYVWTIIEADGKFYYASGFHYVNRFGYILTKNPHDFDIEVEEDND